MLEKILNNKIFKFVYKFLEIIIFGLLILYVAFIAFQRMSNNSAIGGYRMFTIATASMEPVYNIDDVIAVKEVDYKSLKVGDDVTYMGNRLDVAGKIITHRIIKIDTKSDGTLVFTTKGVNNDVEDPTIEENQIFGKVTNKLVLITFISQVIHNQYGFFFLIFSPIVIFIFLEIADTIYESRLEKREKEEEKAKENNDDDKKE